MSVATAQRGRSAGSKPELANTRLVEAEVMPNLVAHRVDDLRSQALRIAAEVAYERVAEDQDLTRQSPTRSRHSSGWR